MPIYEDIARDLLEAIHRGQYPIGGLIPTELELAARYDVSRQTVRAAMRRLTELGAVSRRKGSGTRVETRERPQESFQQTLGSLSDLVELAAATDRDIRRIETVVMDRQAARRFGCQPGSRWLRIPYVRASTKPKSSPLAWVNVYVEESYADAVSDIRKDRRLVCDMIADSYGVIASEVHQTVAATVIPTEYAKALGAEAGSPALEVIRRYLDSHGRLFEISESIHPAGRYVVTSVLKRVGNQATADGRPARSPGKTKSRS
ncbi:GntR family transcriptional regulator [Bradyrhizobium sp. CCBAU 051011]|uniref:GntR family transcriptional regulator n=1 Tax=Bradyrhizobium sp. CCBAU 051011 TaxID=858422 RepID=UPI00137A2EE8|nr:GntR family transcriptional regulator [Bradyrhizobium sp. CCBAU 051011]